jgi:F-type H+-transporting ATPase subunit delta
MGILANHVPVVEALRPGVVEVIEDNGATGKKWFGGCLFIPSPAGVADEGGISVSAGFATVHGNNSLTINAVEAYQLDKFSTDVSLDLYLEVKLG